MNNRLYDPWDDASLLAARGRSPLNRLVVVLGAEAWCSKCRDFKPVFEQAARHAPSKDLWIWLDLEEHADFLGSYLPEDLPELLIYRNTELVQRAVLEDVHQFQALLTAPEQHFPAETVPEIANLLMQRDWCIDES